LGYDSLKNLQGSSHAVDYFVLFACIHQYIFNLLFKDLFQQAPETVGHPSRGNIMGIGDRQNIRYFAVRKGCLTAREIEFQYLSRLVE